MRFVLLLAFAACTSPTSDSRPESKPDSKPTVRKTRVPGAPNKGIELRKLKEQLGIPKPFETYINAPDETSLSEVTSPISSVGMIMRGASSVAAEQHCTGSLIACDTLLTARHCIHENELVSSPLIPNEQLFVFLPVAGLRRVVGKAEGPTGDPSADLAVLYLDAPVDLPLMPLGLDKTNTTGNGQVCGFGYGRWNLPRGLRRVANVSYADCSPNDICWDYQEGGTEQGTTCGGDSGGPLFDASSKQIGVHSSGTSFVCGRSDRGRDVDLSRYKSLIQGWRARPTCSRSWSTWGESGNGDDLWSLHIDENTSVVRIGADGEFKDRADIRLQVTREDGSVLCDEHPAHAWAFCELDHLPTGDYLVNPVRASNKHPYQLSFGAR